MGWSAVTVSVAGVHRVPIEFNKCEVYLTCLLMMVPVPLLIADSSCALST